MFRAQMTVFALVAAICGVGCGTDVEDHSAEAKKVQVEAPNFIIVHETADGEHFYRTYDQEPTEAQVEADVNSGQGWTKITDEVTIDKDSGYKDSTVPALFFVKEGLEGFSAPESTITQPSGRQLESPILNNEALVGNSSLYFGLWFDLNLNLGMGNYYGGSFCGNGASAYTSYCNNNLWGYAAYPGYYGYSNQYRHYYPQTAVRWNQYPSTYAYNVNAGRFFQNTWAYQPTQFYPGVCQCANTVQYYCPNTCATGAQFTNNVGAYAYFDLWANFNLNLGGGGNCYGYRRWW